MSHYLERGAFYFMGREFEAGSAPGNRKAVYQITAGLECAAGWITIAELAFVPSAAVFEALVDAWCHADAQQHAKEKQERLWAKSKLPFGSTSGPIPVR
jgi:hypothetical protein